MTHVEAFMNAEAEAQDEYDRENDPIGYALRTGDIDHLSPADLRKYDELRADEQEAELELHRFRERVAQRQPTYIRLPDVCTLLSVSPNTVWRWVKKNPGFPQPIKLSPGVVVWNKAALLAWVDSKRG